MVFFVVVLMSWLILYSDVRACRWCAFFGLEEELQPDNTDAAPSRQKGKRIPVHWKA
jgi:hypothetical protein